MLVLWVTTMYRLSFPQILSTTLSTYFVTCGKILGVRLWIVNFAALRKLLFVNFVVFCHRAPLLERTVERRYFYAVSVFGIPKHANVFAYTLPKSGNVWLPDVIRESSSFLFTMSCSIDC